MARRDSGYRSVHDLWTRSGARLVTLETLAAADAFRSLGLDRRQALWEVKAIANAPPLPLFSWAATEETGAEPETMLPVLPLSEHVVNDYQTLRLSLKAHPMQFLRERLAKKGVSACGDLRSMRDGARVTVAGVILVRQRPGSAKGVVFMTLEDETGVANAVVWPKTLEKFRPIVMGARVILIKGRIQRHEDIIHVVSADLADLSSWLALLSEDAASNLRIPLANADEVVKPGPEPPQPPNGTTANENTDDDAAAADRVHPRWQNRSRPRPMHPRAERIIPPSRDFH